MPTVEHVASLFAMKKADQPPALKGLKALLGASRKPGRLACDPPGVAAAKSLPAALEAVGFVVRVDSSGDITGLHWGPSPLPSDIKAHRQVLAPLARSCREPSLLVFTCDGTREQNLVFRRRKLGSTFFPVGPIAELHRRAFTADNETGKKRNKALALELYEWLADVQPMSTPGYDRLDEMWREACERLPHLLAVNGRLGEVRAALTRNPAKPVSLLSVCGTLKDEEERPEDALKLARAVLKEEPHHEDALDFLLEDARERSAYAESLDFLERMPNAQRARHAFHEAWCLYSLARYAEASKRLEGAGWSEQTLRGDALEAMGRVREARAAWQRALEAHDAELAKVPASGWHHASRAALLLKLGRTGDARAAVTSALGLERPEQHRVQHALGLVCLAEGDSAGAVKALQTAIDASPDVEHARFDLARALAGAGQAKRARTEAAAAAKMSKDVARRIRAEPALGGRAR